jgi:hypothetical protein
LNVNNKREKKGGENLDFVCRTLKRGYNIFIRENTAAAYDAAIVKDTGEIVMDTMENKKMRRAFGGCVGASAHCADNAVSRSAAGAASHKSSADGEAQVFYNMEAAGGAAI